MCILMLLLPLVPRQEGGELDPLAQVHPLGFLLVGRPTTWPPGLWNQEWRATDPSVLHRPQFGAVLQQVTRYALPGGLMVGMTVAQTAMAAEAAALASGGHDGIHEPLLHPEDNLPPTSSRDLGRSLSLHRSASLQRSTSLAAAIGPLSSSLQRQESGCAACRALRPAGLLTPHAPPPTDVRVPLLLQGLDELEEVGGDAAWGGARGHDA